MYVVISGWDFTYVWVRLSMPRNWWGSHARFVEMMPNGTLRPLAQFKHGVNVNLHPDASLRSVTFDRKSATSTGAGGDNGIAKMWNRRDISASFSYDQSHYLHPHPYAAWQPKKAWMDWAFFRCWYYRGCRDEYATDAGNYTWVGIAPWNSATLNWSLPFRTIANVSESKPQQSPHCLGGQGQTAGTVMDVDDPHEDGAKLLMILEGGNSPGYDRKHLGALRWRPHSGDDDRDAEQAATPVSTWVWTASPGGNWSDAAQGAHKQTCNISMQNNGSNSQTFVDTCIVDADGSLDRCGGHFPCAANVALTSGKDVIYGFNGEGWDGGQANQWLHFDALSGLFIGQFGTVNGVHDPRYKDAGWAAPGCAGNSFAATLVTTKAGVFLYHNDESVHGGVHRWRIQGLENIERLRFPVTVERGERGLNATSGSSTLDEATQPVEVPRSSSNVKGKALNGSPTAADQHFWAPQLPTRNRYIY
jgi:hypothetical protein